MDSFNNEVKVGDCILFSEGIGRPISRDSYGKIILCNHDIELGYAEVTMVKELRKVIMVNAKHILYDVYYNIPYKEFLEVLKLFNFKIGFDREFYNYIYKTYERQILACNLNNNSCVVAETYSNLNGIPLISSLDLYLPGVSIFSSIGRNRESHMGSNNMSVFTLRHDSKNFFNNYMQYMNNVQNNTWSYEDRPYLIPSCDSVLQHDGIHTKKWFEDQFFEAMRLVNPECLKVFEGFGKEILDKCKK